MKLKLITIALAFVAVGNAQAAMQGAASGNGELLLNLRYYVGNNDQGGDDMSALFDLGVRMDDFIENRTKPGFTMTWNLRAPNYGGAWDEIMTFAGANSANIEYNVIALDNTNKVTAGGSRYLTTANVTTYPSLSNFNLNGFDAMDLLVKANQGRGTHPTQEHGASTAVSGGAKDTYFGSVNGLTDGDDWTNKTIDTTQKLSVAQNFWFLTTSSTTSTHQATKLPFGFDIDGNGVLSSNEFGKWSIDAAAGTLTYANPVPEPETYALMLAGLGLVGWMARRRRAA